jgi:uncharacterized protein YodC (DUF2158 family)
VPAVGEFIPVRLHARSLQGKRAIMATEKFQIGDKVRHKFGGPVMFVSDYSEEVQQVTCQWFTKNDDFREHTFQEGFLDKYDALASLPSIT